MTRQPRRRRTGRRRPPPTVQRPDAGAQPTEPDTRHTEPEAPQATADPPGSPDRLLTPQEAADLIHVSRSTLLRWAREGRLASVTVPSGRRRFRLGDLPGFGNNPAP